MPNFLFSVLVYSAAYKFPQQRIGRDVLFIYLAEKLQRGQHLTQLVKALYALRYLAEKLRCKAVENSQLMGEGGIKLIVCLVLIGRSI